MVIRNRCKSDGLARGTMAIIIIFVLFVVNLIPETCGSNTIIKHDLVSKSTQLTNDSNMKLYLNIEDGNIIWANYSTTEEMNLTLSVYNMSTAKITNTDMMNVSWSRIRASGNWLLFNNMSDYAQGLSRYLPLTLYNIVSKQQIIIDDHGAIGYIYDSNIAYSQLVSYFPNYQFNVSLYNLTRNTTNEIFAYPYKCSAPIIWGNTIVWADSSGNNSSIYKYDISTSKIEKVSLHANAYDPTVYNNNLAWFEQDSSKNWSIVTLNMTTGTSTRQSIPKRELDVPDPMMFGDNVIWDGGFQHLYIYNSKYNVSKTLNDFFLTTQFYDIWDNYIVLTGHYENDSMYSDPNIFLVQFQWKEQVIESIPVPYKENQFDLAPVVVSIIIIGISAAIIIYIIKQKRRIGKISFHENLDKSNNK